MSTRAEPPLAGPPFRIVFLDSIREWGGGQKWCVQTAHWLAQRGHSVHIACAAHSALDQRARAAGLVVENVGRGSVFKLAGLLGRERVEVIVANLGRDVRLAAMAKKGKAAALVQRRGIARRIKHHPLARRLYTGHVARMVANCESIRAALLAGADFLEPGRVVVIPNAAMEPRVDPERARALRERLGVSKDACLVAVIARLAPMKGHAHALRAWKQVMQAEPSARLALVGAGAEESRLRALTHELHMEARVHFAGFQEDLDAWHAALDILCLPSVRDEGCNNTLLESMLQAKPAVVTRCGGLPEQVADGETGLVVPIGDEEQLARALLALVRDEPRRRAFGSAARKRAQAAYSRTHVIAAWERLFAELRAERAQ